MRTFAVGIGGALGALFRWMLGNWSTPLFPWGTLAANLTGCWILGWLTGATRHRSWLPDTWRLGIGTGFVGALTTFSAWDGEIMYMWISGHSLTAVLYLIITLSGGILLAWLGWLQGERWALHKQRADSPQRGSAT
ncbi:putative fluoride ion transporter CrcB 2 [Polycladomyces abyssicola]|uniref:Fluoride-specific ion channel FluC n=1 Tax=Polycladomyces abyssicola TaxID=1125966 RepID=A0A8D5ZPZ7_9BACL|nr:fluoride efflux transporter CrcB [Polycladomyces abyssicola]BCU82921.1 putative fluoride ion transporter CrcB 2 [Polycladomyces abyssicola]